MKMTREQRQKYDLLRDCGWEYLEEFPSAGMIVMRRNFSSIMDHFSWAYCTIFKGGEVKDGRYYP